MCECFFSLSYLAKFSILILIKIILYSIFRIDLNLDFHFVSVQIKYIFIDSQIENIIRCVYRYFKYIYLYNWVKKVLIKKSKTTDGTISFRNYF